MMIITKLKKQYSERLILGALGISRSSYYARKKRSDKKVGRKSTEASDIIKIALSRPSYGYRRVAQAFCRASNKRYAYVPYKKVYRVMKKNGLLCKRKRVWMKTTDSNHGKPIFPNRAKSLEVVRINQLWVGDITFCEIDNKKFVYFAFIMDAYSRMVIGWDVGIKIDAQLCLNALTMAVNSRKGTSLDGLIHHTDRGVQYASNEYTKALAENNILGSMSRKGNPYDNAIAESFFKTFKYESLYRSEQESFSDVYKLVRNFILDYNTARLHSSIGYRPPQELENQLFKKLIVNGGKSLLSENEMCYRDIMC